MSDHGTRCGGGQRQWCWSKQQGTLLAATQGADAASS
jgi:hypothetical protein